ncbi:MULTISPECIES: efflux RND transporter permease subunit [Sphingobacterium]|uniref:efflux RND transporter permease subunit n=1 Tax=Sphingobacterium TaxID=28453 RepID=UPI000E0870CE|nr:MULTISPECIES: efflux RND transporter permease subunit [Sphingobacterium]QQT43562.1 efflux RND transporter permease subunit [Sphingobacterium multivorum]SUI97940.1 Multidrug transporter MdtC [Sphingobacterium multivorum]
MIKFLVYRPIAVLTSFFALLLLGLVAYFKLPISLLPDVDIPRVIVKIESKGMSAKEIEARITTPLRSGLVQIKGLDNIESSTTDGRAIVRLLFDRSEDLDMAFIQVNERVDMAMHSMPRDFARPIVAKMSISDIPIFRVNILPKKNAKQIHGMAELGTFANEVIKRRFEQIPEIAMVDITGVIGGQVELIPKAGYLQSLGIKTDILINAFNENNVNLGNILVKDGAFRYYLRFKEGIQDLKSIRQTPILIGDRIFILSDLADVRLVQSETRGYYHANGRQAINLMIIMQPAARVDDLKNNFDRLQKELKKDYPEIEFEITQDQSKFLDYSIGNLQQDLLLGGFLAFFFMLIFIRKLKLALLIGFTVPISLIISQIGFFIFDVSINIISLGGLILGLTMIIDSSIVVMDTISNHQNDGESVENAAIGGTNEILKPLVTSVLTNCAVFIPLIFLGGIAGALFYDQALSIVIGVVSSLIVSILLLPSLFVLLNRKKIIKQTHVELPILLDVTAWYDRLLKLSFRFPIIVSMVVFIIGVCGVFFYLYLDKTRLPDITRYDCEITIDWNEHIDANEVSERSLEISSMLGDGIENLNIWSGEQQYLLPIMDDLRVSQSRFYLKTHRADPRTFISDKVTTLIRSRYPLALVSISPAKNAFDEVFFDDNAPLILRLSNIKDSKLPPLDSISKLVDQLASHLPGIQINPISKIQKIDIELDYSALILHNVRANDVISKIKNAVEYPMISKFQVSQKQIPVVLNIGKPEHIFSLLRDNFVENIYGIPIRLSALVNFSKSFDYSSIFAGKSGIYYPIPVESKDPEFDIRLIESFLTKYKDQWKVVYDGAYFDNKKLLKEMSIVLMISILLLYFILAAQFESLIQPLFILVELPIAISGALMFLYLGNSSLNLMSMIGIIVMSGLIINDSILKIDSINQLRRQGYPLMKAIFEGGHRRLRSIVMISLTSIGALIPTLFMSDLGSELQKPLALALMGGMIIGLFVSLFFVPIVYWGVYKSKEI